LKIITKLLLKFIPQKFKNLIVYDSFPFRNNSFSQEGEDLIIDKILNYKKKGFYIDIGAHHPIKYSNTYIFYKRGWNGINIDAMPDSMNEFKKIRPKDKNIQAAISNENTNVTFYIFNEPALNTLNSEEAKSKDNKNGYRIVKEIKVVTIKLSELLAIQMENNQEIDFMSIDTEGNDLNVLKSNDWEKYRPKLIMVEDLKFKNLEDYNQSEIFNYMKSLNYSIVAKTINTVFYQLNVE
jgi:FkbM family methyltransferase